jgi:hypothetical protein
MNTTRTASTEKTSRPKAKAKAETTDLRQTAELVLDARSLWQMYYVEGIVASEYFKSDFWEMKSEMAELAGLDRNLKFGCPFCDHFLGTALDDCSGCPVDWPDSSPERFKCERKKSPYWLWTQAKSIEEARTYSGQMIKLCEDWLDNNNITYEK